jgi:hypothetical protein
MDDIKEKTKLCIKRYREDPAFSTRVSLYAALLANICYAFFEAGCGLFYHSWWFGTQAFYYLVIGADRFQLAKSLWKRDLSRKQEYAKSRNSGILLLLITIGIVGRSVLITHDNFSSSYNGFIIYGMAAYTFYCVVSAVRDLIKYKRIKSPLLSACKVAVFVNALVSLYSLQTAMLTKFSDDTDYIQRMNAITGTVVCIIVLFTAVNVIVVASVKKEKDSKD